MRAQPTAVTLIAGTRDDLLDHFSDHSGFYNSGYWVHPDDTLHRAQLNLIDRLLTRLSKQGTILDVACGAGASIQYLCRFHEPHDIYGIDLCEERIARCRERVPQAHCSTMDATELAFDSERFDNVICIASAIYFEDREQYFREVFRVLKSGGRFAMHDVIARAPTAKDTIAGLASYKHRMEAARFLDVSIEDVSEQVFTPFSKYLQSFIDGLAESALKDALHAYRESAISSISRWKHYVLVSATK